MVLEYFDWSRNEVIQRVDGLVVVSGVVTLESGVDDSEGGFGMVRLKRV